MDEDLLDIDWDKKRTFQPLQLCIVYPEGSDLRPLKKRFRELLPDTVPDGVRLEIEIYARLTDE